MIIGVINLFLRNESWRLQLGSDRILKETDEREMSFFTETAVGDEAPYMEPHAILLETLVQVQQPTMTPHA